MFGEQFAAGWTVVSLGAIKAIPGEKASTTHWLRYSMAGVYKDSRRSKIGFPKTLIWGYAPPLWHSPVAIVPSEVHQMKQISSEQNHAMVHGERSSSPKHVLS
jgi:hypothetical protein